MPGVLKKAFQGLGLEAAEGNLKRIVAYLYQEMIQWFQPEPFACGIISQTAHGPFSAINRLSGFSLRIRPALNATRGLPEAGPVPPLQKEGTAGD
jgi:hypothetical protein